jgi:hypothetical protein
VLTLCHCSGHQRTLLSPNVKKGVKGDGKGKTLAEWTVTAEELVGMLSQEAKTFSPLYHANRIIGMHRAHKSEGSSQGTHQPFVCFTCR